MAGICLTGDVHSREIAYPEQDYLPNGMSEVDVAKQYVDTAKSQGVSATLFVTGRAATEQPDDVRKLGDTEGIEIGGHTYQSLRPQWLHKLFRIVTRSQYGPSLFQRYDIRRTKQALEPLVGNLTSCRTHAYASDERSSNILAEEGFTLMSDEVTPPSQIHPTFGGDLVQLPINTLRDHGHVYHAERTPDSVDGDPNSGDPFCKQSFTIEEWGKRIRDQIKQIVNDGGIATIQAHPICQCTSDEFSTLASLLEWIDEQGIQTFTCREISGQYG
ncbi:MAG: polysaccharide deacetylase family protein [Halobacteriaceae archaeon]